MEEEWRDIAGYEGLYMVSNLGRVKSLNYNRTGQERTLKVAKNRYGYLYVNLSNGGISKNYTIHRLVAVTFLPNPENYNEINHKDENKENNCVQNLEWCSRKFNCNFGTRNKRASEKKRNDPKRSKPVLAISKESGLIIEYPSIMEAERVTGVSCGHIVLCCKGNRKSAGGYIWQYAE